MCVWIRKKPDFCDTASIKIMNHQRRKRGSHKNKEAGRRNKKSKKQCFVIKSLEKQRFVSIF